MLAAVVYKVTFRALVDIIQVNRIRDAPVQRTAILSINLGGRPEAKYGLSALILLYLSQQLLRSNHARQSFFIVG